MLAEILESLPSRLFPFGVSVGGAKLQALRDGAFARACGASGRQLLDSTVEIAQGMSRGQSPAIQKLTSTSMQKVVALIQFFVSAMVNREHVFGAEAVAAKVTELRVKQDAGKATLGDIDAIVAEIEGSPA